MKLNGNIHNKLLNFIKFVGKEIGLSKLPKVNFVNSKENSMRAFGHFDLKTKAIVVRITDRHPLDVMRTIAHEIVHYKQIITNKPGNEDEANAVAGRIMRKYDNTHPSEFDEHPIKEDITSAVPANAVASPSAANAAFPGLGDNPPVSPKKKGRGASIIGIVARKMP